MTTTSEATAARSPRLREQWRSVSAESVWLRPADWYHPSVDAVVEAMLSGADPGPAVSRLGLVRGECGVGIVETIDDLACLYRTLGWTDPPLAPVRALCEGWVAAQEAAPVDAQCRDPETGLPTAEYLRMRLTETYGVASRAGHLASRTHGLLLVDVAVGRIEPWTRIARSAAVGQALRSAYGDGHPMASLGDGVFAVLVDRFPDLGDGILRLREEISSHARLLGIECLVRQPPRVWLEQLPANHSGVLELLSHIGR